MIGTLIVAAAALSMAALGLLCVSQGPQAAGLRIR
jgi:hypothetical protein